MDNQEVVVEGTAPFSVIMEAIESTGKTVHVSGYGEGLGQAVAIVTGEIEGFKHAKGVIRLVQVSNNRMIIDGKVEGLTPGLHGIHSLIFFF